MLVDIVQWRGEIGTFNNRKKIYYYKGSFCLLSALIYVFVWSLLQIFSMVRFTVNLICFAISSRLFFFAITRIFRSLDTVNYFAIFSHDCKRYLIAFFSLIKA